jgi:hypothetical protein
VRAVIDARENTEAKLQAMLMSLAQKASSGDAVIDSAAFFKEHGLGAVPLDQWHKLISNSLKLLQKSCSLFFQYPFKAFLIKCVVFL